MIVKSHFEIVFRDRSDCEHLLAQVRFMDVVLCELSKENGDDRMEIEFLCNDPLYNGTTIKFSLADFLEVLQTAKMELASL